MAPLNTKVSDESAKTGAMAVAVKSLDEASIAELIEALYKASQTEITHPSIGESVEVKTDPHLRLRRTLMPASPLKGVMDQEAQFMIDDTTGRRENVTFRANGHSFVMDTYVWGASEEDATERVMALHGVSPGISRIRFHQLGERLTKDNDKLRFVALDWHSIDRSLDDPHDEFLTMLPKHYSILASDDEIEAALEKSNEGARALWTRLLPRVKAMCPRPMDEASDVLRAVIEQGLGWGPGGGNRSSGKSFYICVKSWSGAVGVNMLAKSERAQDSFKGHVKGAVIMHPAVLDAGEASDAVKNIPSIMCWAKDDTNAPYWCSEAFTTHPNVELVTYETGGHANFDGNRGMPNFDDNIVDWLRNRNAISKRKDEAKGETCCCGLFNDCGTINDDYVIGRSHWNTSRRESGGLTKMPILADLTSTITRIDGNVLAQLIVSGFIRLSANTSELNDINVFPIADGDTGANMKISLKNPSRNLLREPTDDLVAVSSMMAADVLLNGQGNSGTILAHFWISLAEEIKAMGEKALSVDQFAAVLSKTGSKMNRAVSNPVEGTLISVVQDSCFALADGGPYPTLKHLLLAWYKKAKEEVAKTPDQLLVDGKHILKEAGVVDSGALGFVYLVEGMHKAACNDLEGTDNAFVFHSKARRSSSRRFSVTSKVDHTVMDCTYQYCTECILNLRDGIDKDTVTGVISTAAEKGLGDSVCCISAPMKDGRQMMKVHIHSNSPNEVFNLLRPHSCEPELQKEKVEDMYMERDEAHGLELGLPSALAAIRMHNDLADARFTVVSSIGYSCLPEHEREGLPALPLFVVPASTQEPIDIRFTTESDLVSCLNKQRFESTATRYTTAAPNPMQVKIELLSALQSSGGNKTLLVLVFSKHKNVSALGRNVVAAVESMAPEQQADVLVCEHGWPAYEPIILRDALRCAALGMSPEETSLAVTRKADHHASGFFLQSADTIEKLAKIRPNFFPNRAPYEKGKMFMMGEMPKIRSDVPQPLDKIFSLFQTLGECSGGNAIMDIQDFACASIKGALKEGLVLADVIVHYTGRPDYANALIKKMRDHQIPIVGQLSVVPCSFLWMSSGTWGDLSVQYFVVEA